MQTANPLESALLEEISKLMGELRPDISEERRVSLSSRLGEDLGLDSLSRVELQRRLEERLDRRLDGVAMLRALTLRDLIPHLSTEASQPVRAHAALASDRRRLADIGTFGSITEAIRWHLDHQPLAAHVVFAGSVEGSLTYQDLWQRALRWTNRLRGAGVRSGDRVAVMLPTSPEFLSSFIGILLAGGTPVPLYPPASMDRLFDHLQRQEAILRNCGATVFIIPRAGKSVLGAFARRVKTLREVIIAEDAGAGVESADVARTDGTPLALIQYTSGSTGDPKGVALTHSNLLSNLRVMTEAIHLTPEDLCVSWLPLYHDMGLIGAWLGSLVSGVPLVLMSPLDFLTRPAGWFRAISDNRGTISAGPNFAYQLCVDRITDDELRDIDLSTWRVAMNGAEPVRAATIAAFTERFQRIGFRPTSMTPVYGLAESSLGVLFPPMERGVLIDRVSREALEAEGVAAWTDNAEVELVSSGRPLPDHGVKIVKEGGIVAGEREVGELWFTGPSVTAGYFNSPKATSGLCDGPWRRSGDLAYRVGDDFFIVGRLKDLIIRAGRNIAPQDIEEVVGQVGGVRRGCVAAFASDAGSREQGERLVVVAETRVREPAELARIKADIVSVVASRIEIAPDEVVLVPPRTIPKTSSGKLRRSECRTRYQEGTLQPSNAGVWQAAGVMLQGFAATHSAQWARFRRVPYGLWCYGVFLSLVTLGLPLLPVLPSVKARRAWVRQLARGAFGLAGYRLEARGASQLLPRGIVIANHQSYLDAVVLTALLPPRFGYVAKKDFANGRIIRWLLSSLGTVFVDRLDPHAGAADFANIAEKVRNGDSFVFFPEGTFYKTDELLPFKMGAFVLAAQENLPVIPLGIRGTRTALSPGSWWPKRGHIIVSVGEPVVAARQDFSGAASLRIAVQSAVAALCGPEGGGR